MTRRGRAVLALGLFVYLAAWIFGSRALYPVATGLLFAVVVAVGWIRASNRPPQVRRHGAARDVVEGDDVRIDLELIATGAVAPPTLVAHERPGRLAERRIDLHRVGRRRFAGGYELRAVPRGRYAFETVRLTIEDPFGLARASLEQGEPQALVVYPRLVALDRLFSEGGAHAQDGRRLLLRRPTGYELHSVREYAEGESLRKVHWRSTARRGRLMVKELEDAPRDEVAVLLDGDERSRRRGRLRGRRARGGLDPAGAPPARPSLRAGRQLGRARAGGDLGRAVAPRARAARRRGAERAHAAFALLQADGGSPRARSSSSSSRRASTSRSSTGSCSGALSARRLARLRRYSGSARAAAAPAPGRRGPGCRRASRRRSRRRARRPGGARCLGRS